MTSQGYPSYREPTQARQAPLRPGEELAGKYRIDRVLGAGAMGVVVLAWHIELDQKVAIKFLHPELAKNSAGAERFRREARSAARIRNDHVARVLDVGTLEGLNIPYIVMEYLHGRDLARELGARGALHLAEAARYLLEASEAISEAHARGIIHRDLKPANLFLAERPNGGQMIKVLDFGISKTLNGSTQGLSITDTATLMGSPGYMSPEQLDSSRNVDARSDIWSLGVILYEMVTGALPFMGDSVPQLVRAVITGQRKPLAEHDDALAELEPVVARCLQQDRAERFQSIAQLCEALEPFARSVTGSPYRVGGYMSTEEPRGSIPPGGAPEAGPPVRPRARSEGAWGRTHGNRHSSLRFGVPLAALLGFVVALAFWFIRRELRSAEPMVQVEKLESRAASLEPMPASGPSNPPSAEFNAAPTGLEQPEVNGAAGAAPVAAVPSIPGASAAHPLVRTGTDKARAEPRRAASGTPASGQSSTALPEERIAERQRRAGETGTLEAESGRSGPYEIPEFGGRE